MPGRNRNNIKLGIEVEGIDKLKRALQLFEEPDPPFLRAALIEAQEIVLDEARSRAPGGIKKGFLARPLRGKGGLTIAPILVKHPGARSMEFGRKWYYKARAESEGKIGNNRPGSKRKKRGVRAGSVKVKHAPGQKARPYIGIVNRDQAIGATHDEVQKLLVAAVQAEWDRILSVGE